MKVKNRDKVVGALAFVATACMAFSFAQMDNKISANAAVNEAGQSAFYVQNGASVRTTADTSGIRFTTIISKEYYESVKNSNPTWGTVVGYEEEDADILTLAKANENENDAIYLYEPKTAAGNPVAIQPTLSDDGAYYYYNTVITYRNLTQSQFDYACNVKINVRSYVTYGETTVYSYVDENTDTYRSVTETAEKVLVDDAIGNGFYVDNENETVQQAKSVLKSYINAKQFLQTVSDKVAYSYDMADTGDKLTYLDVVDGAYELVINNVEMGEYTVTNGEITLNENFPSTLVLGEKYTVVLKNTSTTTLQTFKYVSNTISSTDEFNTMMKTYSNTAEKPTTPKKYYALVDNIGNSSFSTLDGSKYCFYDVLDGQGFQFTIGTVTKQGIFGFTNNKQSEAVIKNLSIKITNVINPNNNKSLQPNVFGYDLRKATIENVSVAYTPSGTRNHMLLTFGNLVDGIKMKDVYLYFNDKVGPFSSTGDWSTVTINQWGYIGGTLGDKAETSFNANGVYTVSKNHKVAGFRTTYSATTVKMYCASNETDAVKEEIKTYAANKYTSATTMTVNALSNVYRYDSVSDMKKTVTKVGDWVINDDGTTTWAPEADGFVPEYSEQETIVSIDKTEHNLVNSYELVSDEENTEKFVFSGNLAVPVDGLTAGTYTVSVNGVEVEGAVVTNNLVTFPIANATMTLGGVNTLEVGDHIQPFRYITKVLSTETELQKALHVYARTQTSIEQQRYYVLGDNITIETLFNSGSTNENYTFLDVLDGAGYTISVGTMKKAGLFGNVGSRAVVKDLCVKVTNSVGPNNNATTTSMLAYSIKGATIKNVALIFDTYRTLAYKWNFIAQTIDANTVMEDVYAWIDGGTSFETATEVSGGKGYIGGNAGNAAWETKIKNLYFVAPFAQAILDGEGNISYASNETGLEEGAKKLANLYRYSSAEAMADAGVTQVGNWKIDKNTGAVVYDANSYVSNDENTSNGIVGGTLSESLFMTIEETLTMEDGAVAKSGDETIVKVNGSKLVAVGAGKTTVSVTVGNYTRIVFVVVEDPTATATVENITLTVNGNASIIVKADFRVEYKAIKIVSGSDCVSLSGDVLTALAEGTATVRVAFQIKGIVKVVDVTVTVSAAQVE